MATAPEKARAATRGQRSVSTHAGCPSCRLRFTAAAAAYLVACPECGRPLQPIAGADGVVGFRLFSPEDVPHALPEAVAVSIPMPDPARDARGSGGARTR
jgi:hypothetical protein